MGLAHGLETLIEAAAILKTENSRVQFLIVGEGADKQRILDLAASRDLTNITFLGSNLGRPSRASFLRRMLVWSC